MPTTYLLLIVSSGILCPPASTLAFTLSIARVEAGGHNIPEETIRRRYVVGIDYFFHDYAPICERWILADNSQIPFRVIAEGSKMDAINIKDRETYMKIRKIAQDAHKYDEEKGNILSL